MKLMIIPRDENFWMSSSHSCKSEVRLSFFLSTRHATYAHTMPIIESVLKMSARC